jgi:hypothetical protein
MGSHTGTGEWQSFEARMRRRRAERLASRADVAVAAGRRDEARECLEEGRALAPALPEFDRIEAQLRAPVPPRTRTGARSVGMASAGAAVLLLLGGAIFTGAPGTDRIQAPRDFKGVAPLSSTLRAAASEAAPMPSAPIAAPAVESAPPRDVSVRATAGRIDPPVVAPPVARTPRPPAAPVTVPGSLARPPALQAVSFTEAPALAAGTPAPAVPAVEPTAAPAPAPTAAETGDGQAAVVRRTLDRYAAAYSALDAAAAQRIWPGVNRAALNRAFDTLASQRVSLDDCRVDVAGAAARATCAGSATWAPKVGPGGVRTDPRHWDFELALTPAGWQIVKARVQNK